MKITDARETKDMALLMGVMAAAVTAVTALLLRKSLAGGGQDLPPAEVFAIVFGYVAVLTLSLMATVVIFRMATNEIDMTWLIADDKSRASLSRFQMLLFTFVIAALYFVYSLFSIRAGNCPAPVPAQLPAGLTDPMAAYKAGMAAAAGCSLPEIPGSVLGLLGISGGSYLLSKAIQANAPASGGPDAPAPPSSQQAPPPAG